MLPTNRLQLKSKVPFIAPTQIVPPPTPSKNNQSDEEEGTAHPPPPRAITVADMPLRYELAFDNQTAFLVQSHHLEGFWDNLVYQIGSWKDRVAAHVAAWKNKLGPSSPPYLVLSMTAEDAQALYWAVIPPMSWVVLTDDKAGLP